MNRHRLSWHCGDPHRRRANCSSFLERDNVRCEAHTKPIVAGGLSNINNGRGHLADRQEIKINRRTRRIGRNIDQRGTLTVCLPIRRQQHQ